MNMHKAERYGGNFRSRGSRRRANIVGASMVVSIVDISEEVCLLIDQSTYRSMPYGIILHKLRGILIALVSPSINKTLPRNFAFRFNASSLTSHRSFYQNIFTLDKWSRKCATYNVLRILQRQLYHMTDLWCRVLVSSTPSFRGAGHLGILITRPMSSLPSPSGNLVSSGLPKTVCSCHPGWRSQ